MAIAKSMILVMLVIPPHYFVVHVTTDHPDPRVSNAVAIRKYKVRKNVPQPKTECSVLCFPSDGAEFIPAG